ncbi:4-hydroxy-3-methylbut-2-enyl diphosphate reductase, partial [bacterium]|nr:4-hydroxy-3-methylbut-2-enyl diphosphate reductase [bacterium]
MTYIKIAKTAGFCKGVKRAVEKVLSIAKRSDNKTVTLGPIIHNPQVLSQLNTLGIKSIKNLSGAKNKNVVIRAHGIPPKLRAELKSAQANICDATCPDVARVQGLVKKFTNQGYSTVIIGDKGHAEVTGLLGFSAGGGYVINSVTEVDSLPNLKKICVVAQTTQQIDKFKQISEKLKKRFGEKNCIINNTICPATTERQDEVCRIAKDVDLMIVIGGKNSANTARLAKLAKNTGTETLHIETDGELDKFDLKKFDKIGITAGASTPNWMIKQVVLKVKEKKLSVRSYFVRLLYNLWDFVRESNIVFALSAGCLTYASCFIQGIFSRKEYFLVSFLFILPIYLMLNLRKNSFVSLKRPTRTNLYERKKVFFKTMMILSISALLIISYFLGNVPFFASLGLLVFGLIFQVIGIPIIKNKKIQIRKITQIPGSKDIIVILGWTTVVVFVPLMSSHLYLSKSTFISASFVITLVAIRSIVNDMLETQEDLMVGVETLPIWMGTKKVLTLIFFLVVFTSVMLVLGTALRWIPLWSLFLLLPLWSMYVISLNRNKFHYSLHLKITDIMDFHFVLAGIISYFHKFFT